ncbi:hypothetical protein [Acidovorax sp. SUPP3334]|uniref:hypothetical protein n=1 Tax=Acidovorax sp. SUPP3334 TaxID=2920881 RepID=UPI0023DE2A82|nr:hypothetical protein [Acidovorax sp. SUPP3334]GKT22975.1 hypothetical protein AVHM3334_10155 [Acidovorax sp. SUPP3334]
MNKNDLHRTMQSAVLVDQMFVLIVESLDNFDHSGVVSTFTPLLKPAAPWTTQLIENWDMCSACIWHFDNMDFRCILSEEGQVNIYGPGGKPDRTFQIPDAGVFRPGAAGYGYVNRIRAIGQGLYVCGANRQVYRYQPGERNPLSGQFVDVAGAMRQPPLGKAPSQQGPEFSAWADKDIVMFNDIAGTSEQDIYAVGDQTAHFDGQVWRPIALPVINETMHVVKVFDAQRVLIGGSNGYLFMGNAREGFRNISHLDDNATITGLEWFDDRLFVATDKGIFTYEPQSQRLQRFATGLEPELQDAHLLEAKDGVLWSFGYKDLAYWDSADGNRLWVRVHHPDNARIGQAQARPAASTVALAQQQTENAAQASVLALPAWLEQTPKAQGGAATRGLPDIAALLALVGHSGVGGRILDLLQPYGAQPAELLQINRKQRYSVSLPKLGLTLVMQYKGPKQSQEQAIGQPAHWALAEIALLAVGNWPWSGPWPGGLDPSQPAILEQARGIWGHETTSQGLHTSFFVDGSYGAQWVIELELTPQLQRLKHLKVMHLGEYLPWQASV